MTTTILNSCRAVLIAACATCASCAPHDESDMAPWPDTGETEDSVSVEILETFDAVVGEHPEAVVVADSGAVWVTLHAAAQVYVRSADGTTERRTLPGAPRDGTTRVNGIALLDGEGYIAVRSDDPGLAGVWSLDEVAMQRVAELPAGAGINGMAADPDGNRLYVTDDQGQIFSVDPFTGDTEVWAHGEPLRPTGTMGAAAFGVNGIAIRDGALYVSVPATQSLWRIPILDDQSAGQPEPYLAQFDLGVTDDFDLDDAGRFVGAQFSDQELVLVDPDTARVRVLATAADGLDQPTAAAFAPDGSATAFLTNGAFFSPSGTPNATLMKVTWAVQP